MCVTRAERFFELGESLGKDVLKEAKALSGDSREEAGYKACVFFFFCKSLKTFRAIRVLWQAGFEEDATVLARTLFETAIQSMYVTRDPTNHSQRFWQHDGVERYRFYLEARKAGEDEWCEEAEESPHFAEIKECHDTYESEFPKKRPWWGSSIKKLAAALGPEVEKHYFWVYGQQSKLTHSAAAASEYYFEERGENILVKCSPAPPVNDETAEIATLYLIDTAQSAISAMELPLDTEETLKRFSELRDS